MAESVWTAYLGRVDKFVAMRVLRAEKYGLKDSANSFGSSSCRLLNMMCIRWMKCCKWWETAEVWPHASRDLLAQGKFAPACEVGPRAQRAGRFELDLSSIIWRSLRLECRYSALWESFHICRFYLVALAGVELREEWSFNIRMQVYVQDVGSFLEVKREETIIPAKPPESSRQTSTVR